MTVDGKKIARTLEVALVEKLCSMPQQRVAFVLFGDDAASRKFMEMKTHVAKRVGIQSVVFERDIIQTEEAVSFLKGIMHEYDGIVVQLPIPLHLDAVKVINVIPPEQDIDVLGNMAMEAYRIGTSNRVPPVARAVFEILRTHAVDVKAKKVLIIGNGILVGAPVAALFGREGVHFIQVDKDTPKQEVLAQLQNADVIVSGVGVPHFIKPEMIKEQVILIDAGTSEQGGRLAGDAEPSCAEKASLFTPVPGGVGPITVVSLFLNLCC